MKLILTFIAAMTWKAVWSKLLPIREKKLTIVIVCAESVPLEFYELNPEKTSLVLNESKVKLSKDEIPGLRIYHKLIPFNLAFNIITITWITVWIAITLWMVT